MRFLFVTLVSFWFVCQSLPVIVEASPLSGRAGATYRYGTTDNDDASLLIPGSEPAFQMTLLGRYKAFNLTMNSTLHHNKWDDTQVDLFSLNLEAKRWEVDLGDFFIVDNPLTVNNRLIRGGRFQVGLDGERMQQSRYRLDMFVGQTNEPLERGDNLEGLYNQTATTSTFRRLQWLTKATAEFSPAFEMSATYTGGQDLEDSIDKDLRTGMPLENHVFHVDARSQLFSDQLTILGEYATSQTDSSVEGRDASTDDVIRARLDGHVGNLRGWARWQRVGTDFYSTGYPYLPRDREGILGGASFIAPDLFFLSSEYEQYDNNLEDRDLLTVTTKVSNNRVRFIKSGLPNVGVLVRYQLEDSPTVSDSLRTDRTILRTSLDLSWQLSRNFRASITVGMQEVDDKSLPDTTTVRVNSDEQNLAVNLSLRPFKYFMFSPGLVYNQFEFPDLDQTQEILVTYAITELTLIPQKLRLESDLRYTRSDTRIDEQSYKRMTTTNRLRWYLNRAFTTTVLWKFEKNDVDLGSDNDYIANQVGIELIRVF